MPAAHSLIAHLAGEEPDVLVLELGDGLLGSYGVHALLCDAAIAAAIQSVVLCAQDPVGAREPRCLDHLRDQPTREPSEQQHEHESRRPGEPEPEGR